MTSLRRAAIVGYGLAGRYFHRPLIQAVDGLAVTHVVTANPERREQAVRDVPDVTLVDTVAELWRRASDYDVVVVATANDGHVQIAEAAVEQDKAVVVDKPVAVTTGDARHLATIAASRGAT